MERFRHHGDKIVGRVTVSDCPRRPIADDSFVQRFRAVCDEILAHLRTRPRTVADDNRRQYDALAELNRRNAEFWKGRVS